MIQKTSRDYQSGLCEFVIAFQGVVFLNGSETPTNKHKLFDAIYENHMAVNPELPFALEKEVTFQLLKANNHPVYRKIDRKFTDFNESQALKEASDIVFKKRAIALVRCMCKKQCMNINEVIDIVSASMSQIYENYKEIDKEIERQIPITR